MTRCKACSALLCGCPDWKWAGVHEPARDAAHCAAQVGECAVGATHLPVTFRELLDHIMSAVPPITPTTPDSGSL